MAEIQSRKIEANGLTFAIDEAGSGDTLALLLHGFPEARQAWRNQLPVLAEAGWHVVAPDMRGYGESTRLPGEKPYHIDNLVEDVAALFEVFPSRRRILMAHDWGGSIAWQVAIRKRVKLDALIVLNAPHPAILEHVMLYTWRQKFRSWYMFFFRLPWLPEYMLSRNDGKGLTRILEGQSPNFLPELLEIYRLNIVQPGAPTAMINYYRANAAMLLGNKKKSEEKLAVPTLMIWGQDDTALDVENTYGNENYVSDFTLTRLVGVSHWVQEDAPNQVNNTVLKWARDKGLMV